MATTKVTFTLDRVSIDRLQDAAERLAVAKSEIVREAIMEFHERLGRLKPEANALRRRSAFDGKPTFDEFQNLAPQPWIGNWSALGKKGVRPPARLKLAMTLLDTSVLESQSFRTKTFRQGPSRRYRTR